VAKIKIDGPKRRVYLLSTLCLPYVYPNNPIDAVLRRTNGTAIYNHGDGEVSIVNINPALLVIRVSRTHNVQPEMSTDAVRRTIGPIQDCTCN
jgi:hypothetical protein